MRWLFRLFLSLTFLVSFGHDAAHAVSLFGSKRIDLTGTVHQRQTVQKDRTRTNIQFKFATKHKPAGNHKVYVVEADEEIDESVDHDRLPDQVDLLATAFQTYSYAVSFQYIKKHLHTGKWLSFSSNNKLYLSLKVFRL